MSGDDSSPRASARVLSALLYAVVSLAIMLVNKEVLTRRKFPSPIFLGLGQMTASLLLLRGLSKASLISLPPASRESLSKIFPLPLLYILNMLSGLLVTQELPLPMITVLRRFSILFTMILQALLLASPPGRAIGASVALMILGALLAALNDLSFSLEGYAFITLNNLCTALSGVFTKKVLGPGRDLGPYGLTYFNSLLMILPMGVLFLLSGDLEAVRAFEGWASPSFGLAFGGSCALGCMLIYSSNLCTQMNSPLDTNIIGCLKNILVTYIGMVFGGDYIFSPLNFIGINVSILGSLIYTYISFFNGQKGNSSSSSANPSGGKRSSESSVSVSPLKV